MAKKHDRQIKDFPFFRSNAERLLELYTNLRVSEYELSDFIGSFPVCKDREQLSFGDRELIEINYDSIKQLITNTFPELLPLPWER